MDGWEVFLGGKRTVEDILLGDLNPVPLQLCPNQLNGNSQMPSQECISHTDDQPRSPKRREHQFRLSDRHYVGNGSNSVQTSLLERHTDEGRKGMNGMDAHHHHHHPELRLLFVSRNPTKRITSQELVCHYNLSFDFFVQGLVSYVCDCNHVKCDQMIQELWTIIHTHFFNSKIPIWDFVRFLTSDSQVFSDSQKYALCNMPLGDVVYAKPTLKWVSPESLTAAVVVHFPETTESQARGWGRLCRVRIIFGFPRGIRKKLPGQIKITCQRFAFVEWFSTTASSGNEFYQVLPMKNDRNLQIFGIIPVSDLKGSVPLLLRTDGLGNGNTFLVDAACFHEIASSKCQIDVLGKIYRFSKSTNE